MPCDPACMYNDHNHVYLYLNLLGSFCKESERDVGLVLENPGSNPATDSLLLYGFNYILFFFFPFEPQFPLVSKMNMFVLGLCEIMPPKHL